MILEGRQELNDAGLPNPGSLATVAGLDHLGQGRKKLKSFYHDSF